MKKTLCLVMAAMLLLLCACSKEDMESVQPSPEATAAPTEEPQHSELYLPDYTLEQVLEYFNEVVLDVEYSDGTGDVSLVQKWTGPLIYRIYGIPTDEDWAMLSLLFEQLNRVPGFPGIYAAEPGETENLKIGFFDPEGFTKQFSEMLRGEDAFGATQFWYYTDTNELYEAQIGYRIDLEQTVRSSVLLEEIINTIGITDTTLRTDSIVYQYSNDNLRLSDMDWLIVKLLYNPAIKCGMDKEACAAVIEQLYY